MNRQVVEQIKYGEGNLQVIDIILEEDGTYSVSDPYDTRRRIATLEEARQIAQDIAEELSE